MFASFPRQTAWQHQGARSGFEVVFFAARDGGWFIQACTTAVEEGTPWAVEYGIELDRSGGTRGAQINGRSAAGACSTVLEAVNRLDQTYRRTPDHTAGQCYDYRAPAFDFECRLIYDQHGLVLDYPGIAIRAG